MSKIKLGVTLYSFSTEYCKGIMTLEDCIRTAKELGAEGFEIVATQMIPSYPFISDKFLGEFQAICRAYDMEAICYGANMDCGLRGDRRLNDDEMLDMAIRDLKNAHKMGCKVIREQFLIGPENLVRLANSGAKTIKFIDRTFNCHPDRAYELLSFILDQRGQTFPEDVCFHFEVGADCSASLFGAFGHGAAGIDPDRSGAAKLLRDNAGGGGSENRSYRADGKPAAMHPAAQRACAYRFDCRAAV